MRAIALALLGLAACAQAQSDRDLLPGEPRTVTGIIADEDGAPVGGAYLDHTAVLRKAHVTDAEGRFVVETRAPAVVVRKRGFRSQRLAVAGAADVRITLQRVPELPFRECSNQSLHEELGGWRPLFRIPGIPGVEADHLQVNDVDHGSRSYGREGEAARIIHGCGPMWSFGMPSDGDVWRSIVYEETSYQAGDAGISDAKGELPDGRRWRYLGLFGESAFYRDADREAAMMLDQVMDRVCWIPERRP
jgi:hypothetical protein